VKIILYSIDQGRQLLS